MHFNRRDFLRVGLLTTATTATACLANENRAPIVNPELEFQPTLPAEPPEVGSVEVGGDQLDRCLRLLNRAGYGPRPGDLDLALSIGFESYLEQQLNPIAIDDGPVDALLSGNSLYHQAAVDLLEEEPPALLMALGWETIARKLFSRRQLYEAMVEFWSDHFHIYPRKARQLFALKIVDDREVIRPYALGYFRDLLAASVYSPAMLIYLDNVRNFAESPNENYARELLELHTVGLDAGFSQADVENVARILTGLTLTRRQESRGAVRFQPRDHDRGEKTVMGLDFPAGGGEEEIPKLIDYLAAHPNTAQFIAFKLNRRFVSDHPPPDLVNSTAAVFLASDGDIREVLSHIFLSTHFAAPPKKLKRPLTFFVSACRALDAQVKPSPRLGEILGSLGQLPFMWPAPNGYPDIAAAWSGNLLARWNFSLALAHQDIPDVSFDSFPDELLSDNLQIPPLLKADLGRYLESIGGAGSLNNQLRADLLALYLSSPEFQWI